MISRLNISLNEYNPYNKTDIDMTKKGLLKIQFHSFESTRIKHPNCTVRVKSADVDLTASVNCKEELNDKFYFLPNAEKVVFEMIG